MCCSLTYCSKYVAHTLLLQLETRLGASSCTTMAAAGVPTMIDLPGSMSTTVELLPCYYSGNRKCMSSAVVALASAIGKRK
jgi:hypothetical protein